jgi:calcineurin-like phosphoesterase family protein
MIWFTADTHFNHANIIKYCNRPFKTVEEMDETIIAIWNRLIGKDDFVYHLGDFSMGDPRKYYSRLNGKVFIVPGSHDRDLRKLPKENILPPLTTIETGGHIIVLCHYAMRSWDRSHYATWHLYGHHHGQLPSQGLSFDVGMDCWAFSPISLERVEKQMAGLKPIVDYSKKH